LREGRSLPDALTHGYGYAFWALAFFGAAAIIAAHEHPAAVDLPSEAPLPAAESTVDAPASPIA